MRYHLYQRKVSDRSDVILDMRAIETNSPLRQHRHLLQTLYLNHLAVPSPARYHLHLPRLINRAQKPFLKSPHPNDPTFLPTLNSYLRSLVQRCSIS